MQSIGKRNTYVHISIPSTSSNLVVFFFFGRGRGKGASRRKDKIGRENVDEILGSSQHLF